MAQERTDDFRLIHTKLNRPRIADSLVSRPRLIEQLDQDFQRPLTLVVAPAGYGKSTLVTDWLETRDEPGAWLSLEETDSDLARFLAYFLAAIQGLFPGACPETVTLLRSPTLAPLQVMTDNLINELNEIDQTFVLVLDDYEAIRKTEVHAMLTELLRYSLQNMHLVLITRRNPPLPLPRLRARNQMTEIRTQDLRFTRAEAAAFLRQFTEMEFDETATSLLLERTEGWVTGLRLAILSMRHRRDMNILLDGLKGTNQYVLDYLISEVFSDLSPDTRDYLLKTAILNRLCSSLCDAVVGLKESESHGQASLESIEEANLFIISLDDGRNWFRYHHLYQQFLLHWLQQQNTSDEIAILHTRAAEWYAQNNLIEEAMHHALAAQDIPRAVQLVAQHRHTLMNQDQWQRLASWLHLFPRQVIEVRPELLMLDVWVKHTQSQFADLPGIVNHVEHLLAQSSLEEDAASHLRGEIDIIRAIMHFYAADAEPALALIHQALTILPWNYTHMRSLASMMMAYAYQMTGNPNAAIALVSEGLLEIPRNDMFQTRLLIALSLVYWMEADLENMWLAAARCLDVAQKVDSVLGLSEGQYFQGCVHYHRNDLVAAERAFSAVFDRPYVSHGSTFAHVSYGLALTYQAQGRPDRAREVADSTLAFMMEKQDIFLLPVAQAFQAELAARQGRLAEVGQWASRVGSTLPMQSLPGFYAPQFALPKILLAQDTAQSRQQAVAYLSELHDFVEAIHNKRFLIEVLALQALLHQAQGELAAALDALAQAITLAQPSGFIRLFVDLGPKLEPLLAQLAQNDVAPAYIAQIIAAFDGDNLQDDAVSIADAPQPAERKLPPELLESLTNREMDVLLLLAERLTNKEIAQELGISTETVKRHASNLYQKLDVNNRRQAVAKASALDILSSAWPG